MKSKSVIGVILVCAVLAAMSGVVLIGAIVQLAMARPTLEPPGIPTPQPLPSIGKFNPTMRGCGPSGYIQAYELPDGQKMSEGTDCFDTRKEARKQLQKKLLQAAQVIEQDSAYKSNRHKGEAIERIVLLVAQDGEIPQHAKIIYVVGLCLAEINAPSLELALEFEKMEAWAF
jgi:hypothetical protein